MEESRSMKAPSVSQNAPINYANPPLNASGQTWLIYSGKKLVSKLALICHLGAEHDMNKKYEVRMKDAMRPLGGLKPPTPYKCLFGCKDQFSHFYKYLHHLTMKHCKTFWWDWTFLAQNNYKALLLRPSFYTCRQFKVPSGAQTLEESQRSIFSSLRGWQMLVSCKT